MESLFDTFIIYSNLKLQINNLLGVLLKGSSLLLHSNTRSKKKYSKIIFWIDDPNQQLGLNTNYLVAHDLVTDLIVKHL
jgi:hypothetical protein